MKRPLWAYIGITYIITWTIVLGLYFLYLQKSISLDQLNILFSLGALGPFLSAILTTSAYYGQDGLSKLFSTLKPGKLTYRNLLLAISPLVLFGLGLVLYPIFTGHWFSFETTKAQFHLSNTASYVGWALPFVSYALFEELGWRGFALPHLQAKYSALLSSFFLAFIWAFWHLPFFLWRFQFSIGITIGFFFGILIGSLLLTSLFNLTRGSVLAAIIFHLTNNISSAFDKDYIVAVVSTGFVCLAIFLVIKFKPKDLSDGLRVVNYLKTP